MKRAASVLLAFILTTSAVIAGEAWQASWIGVSETAATETAPGIVLTKALYGVSGDPERQVDLTTKIQQEMAGGNFTVSADNKTAGRDPAQGTVKILELEYTIDGQPMKQSVAEHNQFDLLTGKPVTSNVKPPPKAANQWSCFRRVVHLDESPREAVARIAVDSKYWLWINGELVVFEGQLKRGPTPNDTYHDVVDLAPHLRKGENTIAVLLWYFGKHGFSHKSSGKAGLVFDAVVDGKPLLSDSGWKAMTHPAYGDTDGEQPNMRLPESNIRFDAGKDVQGWEQPGFDDAAWLSAAEYGVPPCAPWNNLVERPVPLWKDFGLKDYVNAADLPKVSDGSTIKAKLPYNAQVTPYLDIEGPAGQLVDIRMDNYKGGGPPNVRAEYVTRDGVQAYENLGWMNGHEMHYTIPAGFKIHALKYRETGYNTEFTGTFECDDEFLNRYRQKALRTLYVTMRDTYYDCPDRERAQWWGDMVNEMGEAFYALDPRSNGLAKKGILELANWQRQDHTIFSPVPAGNWNRELPMQMLNSVGYFGFWTYYLYSGDLDTIRAVYPAVKRYLSIWKLGDDGLVVPRKGGWTWGDWGQNKDMTILFNSWYYLALKGQLNMARAVGEEGDVSGIEARMRSVEENFNPTFWNGKEYRSPGYNGETDDRGHALAVLSGLAKPDQYDAIREVFKTQEHSSPYMEKYVGEALYVMRFEDDAIARTKKRFREMTDHPYTTLWEDWRIGGSGGGTINHAWCGGALTLLSQYGAGVAPVTPGYGAYQVMPQMGPLKHIKTTVPSVKGHIDLELRNEPDSFSMNLTSPADTTALVGMPKRPGSTITHIKANGRTVWENGRPKDRPGLDLFEETEHYIKFSVQPGNWAFESLFITSSSGLAKEPVQAYEGGESLPPLQDGKVPQNLDELWGNYDPTEEPLDVQVVREWEEDGVLIQYLTYTIGTFKGKKSVMSAFYAYPKGKKNLPAFLHIHGGGGKADLNMVKWGAWNGYATLSVNWGGHKPLGDLRDSDPNTDWGALDATQTGHNSHYNAIHPDDKTLDDVESPRNSNWFLLTLGCRRGITFLEQQPEVNAELIGVTGHSMGGKLTVDVAGIDKRVKVAAPSCGGTGSAPEVLSGMPGAGVRKAKSQLVLDTIDDVPYLKRLTCPVIFVSPSNDFAGPMDNMYINRQHVPSPFFHYAISPHFNHRHGAEFGVNTLLIFEQFLRNAFTYPETPKLTVNLNGKDDIPEVELVPDPALPIEKVDVYYSVDPNVLTRFWRDAEAKKEGSSWVAQCPVMSTSHPLYVYANVTYKTDLSNYVMPRTKETYRDRFAISSNMIRIMPDELQVAGVKTSDQPERLVDDFKRGWHDWYRLNWGNPDHWLAATRKLKDPKYRPPQGARLLLDVKTEKDNVLVFEFQCNRWGAYPGKPDGTFAVVKEFSGSPDWQTIAISEDELVPTSLPKTKNAKAEKPQWKYVTEFQLKCKGSVVRDGKEVAIGHSWQGDWNFRNLRWSGGTYPDKIEVSGGSLDIPEAELNAKIEAAIDESWE